MLVVRDVREHQYITVTLHSLFYPGLDNRQRRREPGAGAGDHDGAGPHGGRDLQAAPSERAQLQAQGQDAQAQPAARQLPDAREDTVRAHGEANTTLKYQPYCF